VPVWWYCVLILRLQRSVHTVLVRVMPRFA
jgi:hypothetical protein